MTKTTYRQRRPRHRPQKQRGAVIASESKAEKNKRIAPAGLTPGIRAACAMVRGWTDRSFSQSSAESSLMDPEVQRTDTSGHADTTPGQGRGRNDVD